MKLLKSWPTLYKISSIGKTQQWDIGVAETNEGMVILTYWGYVDGEIQEAQELITEGKNLGKANATTPQEQAESQAQSKWEKQKRFYYAETIEEAKKLKNKSTRPMLASKYEDRMKDLTEGQVLIWQPKLDGMRCIAVHNGTTVDLFSRGQKKINSAPNVQYVLKHLMKEGEIWDGELYNPDLSFEDLMSLARKKEPAEGHEKLQFHVFDVIAPGKFVDRVLDVFERIELFENVYIFPVHTSFQSYSDGAVDVALEIYEYQGFEGIILRDPEAEYEHKRSKSLLKVKQFHDEEYEVVGCEEGTAGTKKAGLLEVFVMVTPEGREFRAPLIGTDHAKKIMWENREDYIGRLATVKYQEKSKYGVPRFPKVKCVRPSIDMS